IRLEIEGPENDILACLKRMEGVRDVIYDNFRYLVECERGKDPRAAITGAIVRNAWMMRGMEVMQMSLEKIFLDLTTREGDSEDKRHIDEGD
ncbi:MAG: hypothetical protein Q8O19_05660, partial [Rectinemataceae bacterium]|nr:hypothetical protein [Rectinemataceae bacterium]